MKNLKNLVLNLALASLLIACAKPSKNFTEVTQEGKNGTLYYGGDIITMEGNAPQYAEAVWVKNGKIAFVGNLSEAEKMAKDAERVDLDGKTLLPSFIDAHSHYFSSLSAANQVNVLPNPAGPGKDVASIIDALKKFQKEKNIPKGEIIQAYGYDDNAMPNQQLLNRDDLDKAFPDNPVIVGHVSMHGGVLNSLALKKFEINDKTVTPPGGIIVRKPGTNEPYGLIMETAYLSIFANLPKPTPQQEVEWTKAGQMMFAKEGITTAHEGATHASDLAVMKRATDANANFIDVIAFPFITDVDKCLDIIPLNNWGKYNKKLKVGGVKITIDGSPQGKTAFFSTPYLTDGPAGQKNWKGELTFPETMITQMVKKVYDMNVPLNIHTNGDGAIDTYLKVHENVAKENPTKDRHVTLIHAQFARKDQLEKFAKYNMTPSLYTLHTYYFADTHIKNRGKQQAFYISPLKDALDLGLKATNHTDFVVAPLDQMMMLWSAVNRISRSGLVIGADQKVSPYQGLQTMTIYPAIQYMEQDSKGSIKKGKLADLVILDQNPLKIDPLKIKDISVLQTIKEGKAVYTKK